MWIFLSKHKLKVHYRNLTGKKKKNIIYDSYGMFLLRTLKEKWGSSWQKEAGIPLARSLS